MCTASTVMAFLITEYLIISSIIGLSVTGVLDEDAEEYVYTSSGDYYLPTNNAFLLSDSEQVTVLLVDGPTDYEGRVEVNRNGKRGTICDDHFDEKAASVVCRMLNLDFNGAQVLPSAFYGEGSLVFPILFDDVHCKGYETNIEDCEHKDETKHNCVHSDDVGVRCVAESHCDEQNWRVYVGVQSVNTDQYACLLSNKKCYTETLQSNNTMCENAEPPSLSNGRHFYCEEYLVVLCDEGFIPSSMAIPCHDNGTWGTATCIDEVNVTTAPRVVTTETTDSAHISCAESTENGIVWPEAQHGQISRHRSCREGYRGDIYRRCQMGVYLNPVDNCTRRAMHELSIQVFNGSLKPTEALSKLKQETDTLTTTDENVPTPGDIQTVNQILNIVIDDIEMNSDTIENDTDSFFEVANNILARNTTSSWKSLINDKGVGAASVLTTIDRFISKVVNSSDKVLNKKFDKPNLLIEIGQVDTCDNITFPSMSWQRKESKERIDSDIVVVCGAGSKVFSGGLFKNMSGMLPTTSNDNASSDISINGPVISFTFQRQQVRTEEVTLTFNVFDKNLSDPSCSFWKHNLRSGKGHWSTDGCSLEQFDRDRGVVTCRCNHLTNFAVLMSPASVSETVIKGSAQEENVHHRRLGVLSLVGCSMSIFGLVLTIIIYGIFWRAVHSTRSILLLNMCTVLVVAYVVFMAGVEQTSNHILCTCIAVLLHYVFLTVFVLMLSEGCLLAKMVLRPLDRRNVLKAFLGFSYGVPMVVVAISAAASKLNGYGNDKFCWLSVDSGLFWAFAGPALAIIIVNTVIMVAVIKRMFGTSSISKQGDADKIKNVYLFRSFYHFDFDLKNNELFHGQSYRVDKQSSTIF